MLTHEPWVFVSRGMLARLVSETAFETFRFSTHQLLNYILLRNCAVPKNLANINIQKIEVGTLIRAASQTRFQYRSELFAIGLMLRS